MAKVQLVQQLQSKITCMICMNMNEPCATGSTVFRCDGCARTGVCLCLPSSQAHVLVLSELQHTGQNLVSSPKQHTSKWYSLV